jgi:hypothetical protein
MTRWYSTAAMLAFLIACGNRPTDDTAPPSGDPGAGEPPSGTDPGSGSGSGSDTGYGDDGSGSGSGSASCPLGTASWTRAIGLATPNQPSDIAVDASGNVLFATKADRSGGADGLTKLSPSGEVIFTRPFGSVVATDRAGNIYTSPDRSPNRSTSASAR